MKTGDVLDKLIKFYLDRHTFDDDTIKEQMKNLFKEKVQNEILDQRKNEIADF